MKVLFTFSGLPHYYNPILNRLNAVKDVEVHVLVPKKKSNVLGAGVHQSDSGIEFTVHYLDEYKSYYGKNCFRGFVQFLKREKPDILITAWPYVLGFVLHPSLMLFKRRSNIKVILKEIPFQVPLYHEAGKHYSSGTFFSEEANADDPKAKPSFVRYMFNTWIRKMYYHQMHAFVNYIEEAIDIIGSYGVQKEKIFITYNSPDSDKLLAINEDLKTAEPILSANSYRVTHIGRLVHWKRVDLLLRAAAIIRPELPQIEVMVIGEGPQKQHLVELARSLGMENNVHFVGSIYDSATIGKYLKASALYVLAGMGGLSINEAMCFGKPIVCSICDGTEKKLVRENYNGKYFRNNDEKDLANTIKYLLLNPALIDDMGKHSLDIIRNEVNVHVVIQGYLKAFSYVMNENFADQTARTY